MGIFFNHAQCPSYTLNRSKGSPKVSSSRSHLGIVVSKFTFTQGQQDHFKGLLKTSRIWSHLNGSFIMIPSLKLDISAVTVSQGDGWFWLHQVLAEVQFDLQRDSISYTSQYGLCTQSKLTIVSSTPGLNKW